MDVRRNYEYNPERDSISRSDREKRLKEKRDLHNNDFYARIKKDPRRADEKSTTKGYDIVSFEIDVVTLADHIARTVIKKQKDYGPNNIRRSPYGPLPGLVVRLYDKIARLANLSGKNATPENESLRDTFVDIAGYAIIGLMILDDTFPKEQ